jgi:hypothetical protein
VADVTSPREGMLTNSLASTFPVTVERIGDMQVEIITGDKDLTINTYLLDIADDPELISSITVPYFHKPINIISPKEFIKESNLAFEYFKAICHHRIPTVNQRTVITKLLQNPVIKKTLETYCQRALFCPCPLFYSIGCPILVDSSPEQLKQTKIVKSLVEALTPIYRFYVLALMIQDSEMKLGFKGGDDEG